MRATEPQATGRTSGNPPGSTPSLVAESLSKSFLSGNVRERILRDLSVSIMPGELTLISGPSGCGKSTLLAILSGMLRPDAGMVRALGQDLGLLQLQELERFRLMHTGFVFQGFNLFPALTAVEQVVLPLRYVGLSRSRAEEQAWAALEEVGMSGRARQRPSGLSGGEQQRVAIARALAKEPELLFADEPTSALDVSVQADVLELFKGLQQQFGFACLFITHDLAVVDEVADRVIVLHRGRVVEEGPSDQVLGAPREEYTRRLIASLPVPDPVEQAARRAARADAAV